MALAGLRPAVCTNAIRIAWGPAGAGVRQYFGLARCIDPRHIARDRTTLSGPAGDRALAQAAALNACDVNHPAHVGVEIRRQLRWPALTAISRRWERTADRYSLKLTRDRAAYTTVFRRLAQTNLTDLDPPRLLYLLLFTHPTPPERLAAAG